MLRQAISKRLRGRSVDWNGIAGRMENESAKGEMGRLRQLFDTIAADNAAVASTVEPIDFGAYKAKINSPNIVSEFEAAYKGLKVEKYESTERASAADSDYTSTIAAAESTVAASVARIAELEVIIEEMKGNRLSKDTTVGDVVAMYPEIGAEVEAEIAAMEWSK